MLKIRQSHDHLIFNMGIPIPGRDCLYIEAEPRVGMSFIHIGPQCLLSMGSELSALGEEIATVFHCYTWDLFN